MFQKSKICVKCKGYMAEGDNTCTNCETTIISYTNQDPTPIIGTPPPPPPINLCKPITICGFITGAILLIVGGCLLGLMKPPGTTDWFAPTLCQTSPGLWVSYFTETSCPPTNQTFVSTSQTFAISKNRAGQSTFRMDYARPSSSTGNLYITLTGSSGKSIISSQDTSISSPIGKTLNSGKKINLVRDGPSQGVYPHHCKGCKFPLPESVEIVHKVSSSIVTVSVEESDYPLSATVSNSAIIDPTKVGSKPPVILFRFRTSGGLGETQIVGIVLIILGGITFLSFCFVSLKTKPCA